MKDLLQKEMVSAMKSKNKKRLSVLRLINVRIDDAIKNNNNDFVSVLDSMVKEREKTIDIYSKANETEKANEEKYEVSIIEEFLPKRMSISELEDICLKYISESNASSMKDMGKVMSKVKDTVGDKAKPSDIAKIIKDKLANN